MPDFKSGIVSINALLLIFVFAFGWNVYSSHQKLVQRNVVLESENTTLHTQLEELKKDQEVRVSINATVDASIQEVKPQLQEIDERLSEELGKERHRPTPPAPVTDALVDQSQPVIVEEPIELMAAWDAYCLVEKESNQCTVSL